MGARTRPRQLPTICCRRLHKVRAMTASGSHGPFHRWHPAAFIVPGDGPVKGRFSVRKVRMGKG